MAAEHEDRKASDNEGDSHEKYSYSSTDIGMWHRLRELYYLIKKVIQPESDMASWTVKSYQRLKGRYEEIAKTDLADKDILDIGPGQNKRFMHCFGLTNKVVGIDYDVLPDRLGLAGIVAMYRQNSFIRTLKTLGRKLLRTDEAFVKSLYRELDATGPAKVPVVNGNAQDMPFDESSFDFIYSFSVFEHLQDPRAALKEVVRVLRPSGVAVISLHLYTSHSGIHDPKIFSQWRPQPPFWPHLRPRFRAGVQSNSWLNELTLAEWQQMFADEMPGVTFSNDRQPELVEPLAELRAAGELKDYSDDELLTVNVVGVWQKPPVAGRLAGNQ